MPSRTILLEWCHMCFVIYAYFTTMFIFVHLNGLYRTYIVLYLCRPLIHNVHCRMSARKCLSMLFGYLTVNRILYAIYMYFHFIRQKRSEPTLTYFYKTKELPIPMFTSVYIEIKDLIISYFDECWQMTGKKCLHLSTATINASIIESAK